MKTYKFISAVLVALCALCAAAAEPEIKVALAGSSACQGYGLKDNRCRIHASKCKDKACREKADKSTELIFGWGEFIDNYFTPNVKVLNFAISGQSTVSFRSKGTWAKLMKSKPDYIFMTLGANDTPGKKFASDPKTTYKENLRRYAAEAQKIGAKMIFVTINQSLSYDKKTQKAIFPKAGPFRKDRVPYSQAMREVAAELKLPCLELAENQKKYFEAMGEEAAGKLYRYNPALKKIDPSHTNKAGAELLAKIIMTELRKSNSDLKKYTIDPKLTWPAKKAAAGK